MRYRTTFTDCETFDVAASGERLFYGPRTASALGVIMSVHADIIAERERDGLALSNRMAELRRRGLSRHEAIAKIRRTDPELWRACFPGQSLDRVGFVTIHAAAIADTEAILADVYAGRAPVFIPCETPREAWERYGTAA